MTPVISPSPYANAASAVAFLVVMGAAGASAARNANRRPHPAPLFESDPPGPDLLTPEPAPEPSRGFLSCLLFGIPVLILLSLPLWVENFPFLSQPPTTPSPSIYEMERQ